MQGGDGEGAGAAAGAAAAESQLAEKNDESEAFMSEVEAIGAAYEESQAGPDTSPLSQLNLSSCVPVTTQLIPPIHSEMLKLS